MIHDLMQVFGEGGEAIVGELHGGLRIVAVETDEGSLRELCSHLFEGEADDDGGVETHPELQ